jgi:hypothetical protein
MSKAKFSLLSMLVLLALPSVALAARPSVSTISPASATAGGAAFTLTVKGSNFVGNGVSVVQWNGADLTTTFVSSTQLTASVASSQIASAGSATVAVRNTGRRGGTSNSVVFTINAPASTSGLAITTTSVSNGLVSSSYNAVLNASGGTTPYTWSLSSSSAALPSGLTLSSSGTITGTPSQSGTFSFTAQVADSASHTATQTYGLTIASAPPPLAITTTSLPGGTSGKSYNASLSASGGTPAYTWALGSNTTPPPGVALSSSGTISGTPSQSGTYSFTVQAIDQNKNSTSATLSLNVAAPPAATVLLSDNFGSGNFSLWSSVIGSVGINSTAAYVFPGDNNSAQIHYYACGDSTNSNCGSSSQDRDDSLEWYYPTGLNHFTIEGKVYFQSPNPGGTKDGMQRKIFYIFDQPSNGTWSIFLKTDGVGGAMNMSFSEQTGPLGGGSYVYDCGTNPALCATLNYDTWYDIKMEIKTNTNSSSPWNGVCNIWVNGTQVFNVTGFDFNRNTTDPLRDFRVGMQANRTNWNVMDEYRYWDDVVITQLP